MRKAQRIAQGVELVLALVHPRLHFGFVALPLALSLFVVVEGVGVGVVQKAVELTHKQVADEIPHGRVVLREPEIRPYLLARVPEPHGVYIAGDDVAFALHRRVKRVRVACLEHLPDALVAYFRCDCGNRPVYGFRAQCALFGRRTRIRSATWRTFGRACGFREQGDNTNQNDSCLHLTVFSGQMPFHLIFKENPGL